MFERWILVLAGIFVFIGCHEKKAVKTEDLENAFKSLTLVKGTQPGASSNAENALIAAYVDGATAAIKTNDYFGAVVILQDLRSQPNLSFDQSMSVQNTMADLQMNLVRRAEAGDVTAQQSLQALKMKRRR